MNNQMIFKKSLILIFSISVLIATGCNSDDENPPAGIQVSFKSMGLEGRIINEIGFLGDGLYAATDDGLYVRNPSFNTDWKEMGLKGKNARAFLEIDQQIYLVSVTDPSQGEHELYRSNNGGSSWDLLTHNFGGNYPEAVNDFVLNQDQNEVLASGNGVIASSADNGETWVPIHGDWQMVATGLDFVEINPVNGDIWSGGQNGIEGFTLSRFSQTGKAWQDWINLLPSPSTAKDIAFDPSGPSSLIIGGEDGIIETHDNGASWDVIKEDEDARFYFGVEYDQQVPSRIYAMSWVKNFTDPQPLILYMSLDSGTTWQKFEHDDPGLPGGVWDMAQRRENNQTKLYAGLHRGGVFEVTIAD